MPTRVCSFHHCFFFFLLFAYGFTTVVESAVHEIPLSDLLSRDEWRQIAGYGEERLSTVLVTGSLLCEACLHGDEPRVHAWPVKGAMVGVKCHNSGKNSKSSDWVRGITDEFGDFIIDIPSRFHATQSFEKVVNSCNYRRLEEASARILLVSSGCSTKHLNPYKLVKIRELMINRPYGRP